MSDLDKDITKWDSIAVTVLQSPSSIGIISAFGYVGHLLVSGKTITRRRIVGGIMLSMFTGTCAYFLAVAVGLPERTSVPIALLLGSLCETGYMALTDRAKELMGKKD